MSTVYVSNNGNGTVSVVDTGSNTITGTITVGSSPKGIAVTPDGSQVWVCNNVSAGSVSVISTSSNTVIATITGISYPASICFTRDGLYAFVGSDTVTTIYKISVSSRTVVTSTNIANAYYGITVDPTNTYIYPVVGGAYQVKEVSISTDTLNATRPSTLLGGYAYAIGTDSTGANILATGPGENVYTINRSSNTVTYTYGSTGMGSSQYGSVSNSTFLHWYVVNDGVLADVLVNSHSLAPHTFASGHTTGGVAITNDDAHLYVADQTANSLIYLTVNAVVTTTITGFSTPWGVAITPAPPATMQLVMLT